MAPRKETKEAPLTSIAELKGKINKRYGEGSLMDAGDLPKKLDVISTGSLKLDLALGVGGVPRGRVTEIYGPESGGKSTLALHIVAEAQKDGLVAALVDAEHSLDPVYAEAIGVDVDSLLICQPFSGEQALNIVDEICGAGLVGLIVVDSVDALTPEAALKGEIGDANVAALSRLMSQTMRMITHKMSQTHTAVVFINQIREKVGVMFGSPETTPGGRALKFYSTIRLDVRRVTTNKDEGVAVSNETKVKVVKNKVAPPFREALFDIEFGVGIDRFKDLLDVGEVSGVLQHEGNTWLYEGVKLGGSRSIARDALEADPETAEMIRKSIREALFGGKDE